MKAVTKYTMVPPLTLWWQLPNIRCISIKTWDSISIPPGSRFNQLFSIPSWLTVSWLPWEGMAEDIPYKRKLWALENLEIQGERRVTILETQVEKRLTTRWDKISQVTWDNLFKVDWRLSTDPGSSGQSSSCWRPFQKQVGNPLQLWSQVRRITELHIVLYYMKSTQKSKFQ